MAKKSSRPATRRVGGKTSNSKVLTSRERLVNYLVKLKEDELTKTVIMPLLIALKFRRVDYNGGLLEGGKDIICTSTDQFDRQKLTAIQVKRVQPGAAAKTSGTILEVITQLSQCVGKEIALLDGTSVRPDEVLFITPSKIDSKSWQERFEGSVELRDRHVTIIEGEKLAELVEKHLPAVCLNVSAFSSTLSRLDGNDVSNSALMMAINSPSNLKVEEFYLDLDLLLGRYFGQRIFQSELTIRDFEFKCNAQQWKTVKSLAALVREELKIELFAVKPNEVERNAEILLERHQRLIHIHQNRKEAVEKISTYQQKFQESNDLYTSARDEKRKQIVELRGELRA